MTAIDVICHRPLKTIFVLTDGAGYDADGKLLSVSTKVFIEPNWPGLVTGRGSAIAVPLLGNALACSFTSFDDMITNVETVLPGMVEYYGIRGGAELFIAGFSMSRSAPELYFIRITDEVPVGMTEAEVTAAREAGVLPSMFRLTRQDDRTCTPNPTEAALDEMIDSGEFDHFDLQSNDESTISGSLAQLIEAQRRSVYADGICWVGGNALLTVLRADGEVEQRIVKRWPDVIGAVMQPAPIDRSRFVPFGAHQHRSVVPFKPRKQQGGAK